MACFKPSLKHISLLDYAANGHWWRTLLLNLGLSKYHNATRRLWNHRTVFKQYTVHCWKLSPWFHTRLNHFHIFTYLKSETYHMELNLSGACHRILLVCMRPRHDEDYYGTMFNVQSISRCWLGGRKGIRPVKTEWWDAGRVICLGRVAALHIAQLMPLLLTSLAPVNPDWYYLPGFTFLVLAQPTG